MTDWKLQIDLLEDTIKDLESASVEDGDKFNYEISRLRDILDEIKRKLEARLIKEYLFLAQSYD